MLCPFLHNLATRVSPVKFTVPSLLLLICFALFHLTLRHDLYSRNIVPFSLDFSVIKFD